MADVTVNKPRPIVGINGERYETPRLSLDITHVKCSDGMSDRVYRDTVSVVIGRKLLRGCGGERPVVVRPSPASILDGEWTIQSVGGRLVAPRTSPDVSFSGDRISGDASCNQFNGSFRFARGVLDAGPLATTRRACVMRGANAQEAAILRLFGQRLSVSRNRNGKLVLAGRRGEKMVLAPRGRR